MPLINASVTMFDKTAENLRVFAIPRCAPKQAICMGDDLTIHVADLDEVAAIGRRLVALAEAAR